MLVGLFTSTALLATGLITVGYRYLTEGASSRNEIGKLRGEVVNLRNLTSAEINTKLAALKKSEKMIADLQTYLRARGVNIKPVSVEPPPGQPNPAAGGPVISAQPVPFTGSFAHDAENLLQAVQNTPLGMPHIGALTAGFGLRPNPFTGHGSEFHPGLDFKGNIGEPAHVTAQGRVIFAGWRGGYGQVVEVGHANGYATLYGHLSRINVVVGQQVAAGDTVGLIGSTGRSTGPHLHYEVQLQGARINPIQFLALNTPLAATP
jgi:murein DD-endopeptidase MepM/ murein hydrolase activator NlpD